MSFLSEEMLQQKTSQELTMLLYEACEQNIQQALDSITTKQYMEANQKFQRSIDILERLGVGLNDAAGIIADQLDALYTYMRGLLIEANIEKSIDKAQRVLHILQELQTAWQQAMQTQKNHQPAIQAKKRAAYEQFARYEYK
ncbi:flagellar protein FliS [Alteribacillus persepolensis]|uniref:Flagellar protein FliS n=1 Tax=Alteribacillus persepolensis TaxID=568899 RepID=A0A1G8K5Y5_9BACI|nr:flagellar export chaperone FliS [Alteribacillus persepolensis]SDI38848.1 flagellar protein FliS [Alteribacillus persepolensis]